MADWPFRTPYSSHRGVPCFSSWGALLGPRRWDLGAPAPSWVQEQHPGGVSRRRSPRLFLIWALLDPRKTSQNCKFTLNSARNKHCIFANFAGYSYLNVKNMSCNAKYFDTYIKYSWDYFTILINFWRQNSELPKLSFWLKTCYLEICHCFGLWSQ